VSIKGAVEGISLVVAVVVVAAVLFAV